MRCGFCNGHESKVIDSRQSDDGSKIRRRRECVNCLNRFTTYEIVETTPLMVVKRDNTLQPFDKSKVVNRVMNACAKRPVSIDTIEQMVDRIEQKLANAMLKEVQSTSIGDVILSELKDIDKVAYIRFASVYKDFSDVDSFLNELKSLKGKKQSKQSDKT